jgi:hypothetical protein
MTVRKLLGRLIRYLSVKAVHQVVRSSSDLDRMWKVSMRRFPSFNEHFSNPLNDREAEARVRFLIAAECAFMEKEVASVLEKREKCSVADIGDSDGSVRIVIEDLFGRTRVETVGINLQPGLVERMNQKGLNAICADAIEVGNQERRYNVVSLFETMEHLPDPIGFLQKISPVVEDRLVVSVPYVRRSRVGLYYTGNGWPEDQPVTIETVHIFELSPEDWRKVFLHSGWRVEREAIFKQFPASGPLNWILTCYWRCTSFEGFYLASLVKDTTHSSRYHIG